MNTLKKTARKAGLFYFFMAVFYSFSMIFVDANYYVSGNIEKTIFNLTKMSDLLLLGFIAVLIGHISFLIAANYLYELFNKINKNMSRLMVIFVIVGVAIAFLNRITQFGSFVLIQSSLYSEVFGITLRNGIIMLLLDLHIYGEKLAMIFWGLWLIPLAYLIVKSNYLPKIIGWLLFLTGSTYIANAFFQFLNIELGTAFNLYVTIIGVISEISLMLWLLICGVKKEYK